MTVVKACETESVNDDTEILFKRIFPIEMAGITGEGEEMSTGVSDEGMKYPLEVKTVPSALLDDVAIIIIVIPSS